MLVLKAIAKTISGILGTLLMMVLFGALFFGGAVVIGFTLRWIYIILATIVPGFAAFMTAIANNFDGILLGLAIITIVVMFGFLVQEEYDRLKAKAKGEAALK